MSDTPQFRDTSAPSFTATNFTDVILPDKAPWEKPKLVKSKGRVVLDTNFGEIRLSVHCDQVPILAENFMSLCASHAYDGTVFHRIIRGFMMQGGDPTNTGKGGQSFWGVDLKDDFKAGLKHDAVGVVSMANHGPDTNGSQFFITFQPLPHLNRVHSVVAKVVDGFKVLKKIEAVDTNDQDHPLRDVVVREAIVEYNPFDHLDAETTRRQRWLDRERVRAENARTVGRWLSNPSGLPPNPLKDSTQVGKYLPQAYQELLRPRPPRATD